MSLHRHPNKVVERAGVNYIRALVESQNSVFNEIDLSNDLGIDCYIDFTINNSATGFTVCAQIKSGVSFKDSRGYTIPADKAHMELWAKSILPVIGLVYDPEVGCAFWISISEYLRDNPKVLSQNHHDIRVERVNRLDATTFAAFRSHLIERITEYKSFENLGRSLDEFSQFENQATCYNGLKSLFSNHADKISAWTFIITCFEHIKETGIHGNILGMLSNFIDNADIFWDSRKPEYERYQKSSLREQVLKAISRHFSPESVRHSISFLQDGIMRGTLSYLVFLVLEEVDNIDKIIYTLATDETASIEERQHLYWLYAHFAQRRSKDEALARIREFVVKHPDDDGVLLGTVETIERDGYILTG